MSNDHKPYNGSNDLKLAKANSKVEDIETKIRQKEAEIEQLKTKTS